MAGMVRAQVIGQSGGEPVALGKPGKMLTLSNMYICKHNSRGGRYSLVHAAGNIYT